MDLQKRLQESPVQPILSNELPPFVPQSSLGAPRPSTAPFSNTTQLGFTKEQLAVLRQQILVFRRMKKQEYAIDSETLERTKPFPLTLASERVTRIQIQWPKDDVS